MSSDEFDSSSTLYECIVFSKIYFGYILSYIGISELACSAGAYQLIGLYMSYRDLSWINFWLCYNFLCFVLGINSCTLCQMIAEAWNFKLHNKSYLFLASNQLLYIYIYIYIYIYKIFKNLTYDYAWNTIVMSRLVAPSCYLELLRRLQKQISRTVGPSLAASLEPLVHCQNLAS